MKILALEVEIEGVDGAAFQPHLKNETRRVLELMQQDVLREIYFREDKTEAVLVLECADEAEARAVLATLPLVEHGLIDFEVIPLVPYPGFSRLVE